VWARGITTTYSYDNGGSLATVVYSDGTTPNVTNTFDRLGRQSTIACGGMTNTMVYNSANQLLSETFTGGTLAGLAVTNAYDNYLRRSAVALSNQTSTLVQYGYDNASRLQNVTNGTAKITYAYLANSPLVGQISFTNSGVQRMVTTKTYDFLNRLTSISSAPSAASPVAYTYTYNNANQRVRNLLADSSSWQYSYDSLGQVVSGHKFFADGTPVAGQQFDYSFDNIGNRTQTLGGGDQSGLNQRLATYGANNLNQYTNRTVPGFADVMGIALATNTVTVGGQTAYRYGEYFRDQLPVSNTSAAVWTNIAVSSPAQTSITGNVFVAQTPENFSYDGDGNLTGDGRCTYTWDAENRLVSMQGQSGIPTGAKYKLDFIYDSQSRRIQKLVSTNSGSAYVAQTTNRFIYDRWSPVAILNPSSAVVQSLVWGMDIFGDPEGSPGIGALLQLNDASNGSFFVAYDGNGNIEALTRSSDGTLAAQYEYGPFAEGTKMTGPMARSNVFRFATKYVDDESDMAYYGYRYFNPMLGRWLSRDPAEEGGGANVYGFACNEPVSRVDPDGLWDQPVHFRIIDKWLRGPGGPYSDHYWHCVPINVIKLLKEGSDNVDGTPLSGKLNLAWVGFYEAQRSSESYKHAMSAWNEPREVAAGRYAAFVADRAREARSLSDGGRELQDVGWIRMAVERLGEAFHSYSDSLSPAHHGFQPWYGPVDGSLIIGPLGWKRFASTHHDKEVMEKYTPLEPDIVNHVDEALKWVLDYVLKE
jgi:RHS repeat-associated protein